MFRENPAETAIAVIFILILILFLNPFGFWMLDALEYMIMAGIVIVFALFAGLVLKEKARDERELSNKNIAGRVGYLTGVGVLVLGLVVEGVITANVDPWLVSSLALMVLARLVASLYVSSHR